MGDATDNRFYRQAVPVLNRLYAADWAYREMFAASYSGGSYRDEFNTTADYDNGLRAAVRLAHVLMEKHFPEAAGWEPAPDLLGVITQLDHITAHLYGCFAGPAPEPTVSTPPAADAGAPCTLADRVGTSANPDPVRAALIDMLAGWRYIRTQHGDLPGVGWERCQQAAEHALAATPHAE